MKTINKFLILSVLTLTVSGVFGQNDSDLQKEVKKTFTLKGNDKVSIDNKFGEVHIDTWDKNTLEVTVTFTSHSRSEKRAKEMLDRMDVEIKGIGNGTDVSFTTVIADDMDGNRDKEAFMIDYKVNMPKSNPLDVKNKFGHTYLADFNGPLNMNVKYGELKMDRITGDSSKVSVAFGGAVISELKSADLKIKYGKLKLDKGGEIRLENGYSDVKLGAIQNLITETKYGKFNADKIDDLAGAFAYTNVNMDELLKSIKVQVKYCSDFAIDRVGKDFNNIDIQGKYSSFDFSFMEGASFDFEFDTEYGSLINYPKEKIRDMIEKARDEYGKERNYKGSYGPNPKGKVKIDAKYGNIEID